MRLGHPIDGSLPSWPEVSGRAEWGAVLLGNGMSVNVWPGFAYRSLYETAARSRRLHAEDQRLFERFGTENFETVLAGLSTTIAALGALGRDAGVLEQHRRAVRSALGSTIHAVHVRRADVDDDALGQIKRTMLDHSVVFTTNYDLLVYWAMGQNEDYGRLADLFWAIGEHGARAFDPAKASVWRGWTPVYYLHGALHLIVRANGTVEKLRRTPMETILEQFDGRSARRRPGRPLLVTEGTASEKRRAIDTNAYLRHAFGELCRCALPLVVFGSSLGDGDRHLVDAINLHAERPVAVSMLPRPTPSERLAFQGEIRARLHTSQLEFFDATTHPLGDPALRADRAPRRSPVLAAA
jgi:hypothetical protein